MVAHVVASHGPLSAHPHHFRQPSPTARDTSTVASHLETRRQTPTLGACPSVTPLLAARGLTLRLRPRLTPRHRSRATAAAAAAA
jgi:hypothetical protein